MKLRDLLNSGICIEGYRKIQRWGDESTPYDNYEGYDNNGLPVEYLDRDVTYISPYTINLGYCTIAAIYIEIV